MEWDGMGTLTRNITEWGIELGMVKLNFLTLNLA
jgi:hypothetical protein